MNELPHSLLAFNPTTLLLGGILILLGSFTHIFVKYLKVIAKGRLEELIYMITTQKVSNVEKAKFLIRRVNLEHERIDLSALYALCISAGIEVSYFLESYSRFPMKKLQCIEKLYVANPSYNISKDELHHVCKSILVNGHENDICSTDIYQLKKLFSMNVVASRSEDLKRQLMDLGLEKDGFAASLQPGKVYSKLDMENENRFEHLQSVILSIILASYKPTLDEVSLILSKVRDMIDHGIEDAYLYAIVRNHRLSFSSKIVDKAISPQKKIALKEKNMNWFA